MAFTIVLLSIFLALAIIGWVLTLWLLTKRSFALVDIAHNGHLSGKTLAKMAHEALGSTWAINFKKDYGSQ